MKTQTKNKLYTNEIPNHFPHVYLDAFCVMPNHIHGIVIVDDPYGRPGVYFNQFEDKNSLINQYNPTNRQTPRLAPGQKRFQNQGQNTISSIIGSYKSIVTRHARKINPVFAWQSWFWDHIIRENKSYQRIRQYIINNPKKWESDCFFGRQK